MLGSSKLGGAAAVEKKASQACAACAMLGDTPVTALLCGKWLNFRTEARGSRLWIKGSHEATVTGYAYGYGYGSTWVDLITSAHHCVFYILTIPTR